MDETMLTLKPGVTLKERDGQTGLVFQERVQYAKDARQAEILRVLVLQSQSLENLMAILQTGNGPPGSDHDGSLTMAQFILDFGEYLES